MEFGIDNIHIPSNQSFIVRKLEQKKCHPPRVHAHKNYELNFVLSGAGRRIVGNHISSFKKGDLVLLGPDLPHCWEILHEDVETPSSSIVIHFQEDIMASNFFNVPELKEVIMLFKQANEGIWFKTSFLQNKRIKSCLEGMLSTIQLNRYIHLLKLFGLFLKIQDREYLSDPMSQPLPFSKDLDRINLVYEYVFRNIERGIQLEEAAALLNMAPPSFCRYFKRKTTLTFMQYVKRVRIGIAARMLAETEKQITRICYESGYNNLANFNHQFKSMMNTTPTAYRKNFR